MTLTVLTDDQISGLVSNLTREELQRFMGVLSGALHEYSTATTVPAEAAGGGGSSSGGKENVVPEIHQPERTSIRSSATGATTLFMPSSSSVGTGVKVVTLTSPSADEENEPPKETIRPTGAITLFSPHGTPLGFLHASTLTAFRTALASLLLISKRDPSHLKTFTVFGTGAQAYWHIRLSLSLLGPHIRQINILSRSFSPAVSSLLNSFLTCPLRETEGWSSTQFSILTPAHNEYSRLLEEQLLDSDVIICCTPSTTPLWDGGVLTSHEGRQKGRLIVAVGSYKPNMQEIPQEVIRQALKRHFFRDRGSGGDKGGHWWHWHRHAEEGGVVVVDTLDGALKEAGELIRAGVRPEMLVELGELVMLNDYHEQHHHHRHHHKKDEKENKKEREDGEVEGGKEEDEDKDHEKLAKWLAKGNVIYKSVGLGLMDLSVGMEMVRFAGEKGVGSRVDGF